MLVLLLPALVAILAVASVVALARKAKIWFAVFLVLCLLCNWWSESVALHPFGEAIAEEKEPDVLRVITYNLHIGGEYLTAHENDCAEELLNAIMNVKADVVVLCELTHIRNLALLDTLTSLFPYNSTVFTRHNLEDRKFNGTCVFSRYEIKDCGRIYYNDEEGNKSYPENWLMKIESPQGDFMLTACHFASNNYINDTTTVSLMQDKHKYLKGLQAGYKNRAFEAEAIRDSLDKCNLPVLLVGDLNDVGGSYAVRHVKGNNLVDAWWQGGFGFGNTYHESGLFFRLDHILYSEQSFELLGVKVLDDWNFSDHYPIVADLRMY